MKKGIFLLAVFGIFTFTSCEENASSKVKAENVEQAAERDAQAVVYPEITFDETVHDFGEIAQGTNVEHVFTFKNTGRAPLVITDAQSTCGCTVPEYTEEPIAPGETGELLVTYNGSGRNQVTKIVTITANTEKGKEEIKIKAFVIPEEEPQG